MSEPELPNLLFCYLAMVYDQGVSAGKVDKADFLITIDHMVDERILTWNRLVAAEAELAKLSVEERSTLAIGDQDEWPAIFKKMGRNHKNVHRVLDILFENMMGFYD